MCGGRCGSGGLSVDVRGGRCGCGGFGRGLF